MTFTDPGFRGKQDARYGATAQTITHNAQVNGANVTPTGTPTFATFRNGQDINTETPLASGNCTVSGSTITASHDLSDTGVFIRAQNYRCIITFVAGGVTYKREELFDVVEMPNDDGCPITVEDLKGLSPRLDAAITQQALTAAVAAALYIQPAWKEVRDELLTAAIEPSTVDPSSLWSLVRYRAGEAVARGFLRQAVGDVNDKLGDECAENYKRSWASKTLLVRPGDGSTVEENRTFRQPRITTGPDYGSDNGSRLTWRPIGGDW